MARPRFIGPILLAGFICQNSYGWKSPTILESKSYHQESPAESKSLAEVEPETENHAATMAEVSGEKNLDMDDQELQRLWKENPEALGSISAGFTDAGRLINGVPFPEGEHWTVSDPTKAYGTTETIQYVTAAIREVAEKIKDTPRMRISHLSTKDGGYLRPHLSHQSGRDIDLPIYRLSDEEAAGKKDRFDLRRNWALVRALVIHGDVQLIILDKNLQKRLYDHALSNREDKAWLDSLFRCGHQSLIRHASNHRDHFHIRFYNPRAQELGRRIQPLLPLGKAVLKMANHRIREGDSLGTLANKYGTSVTELQRINQIQGNAIRAGKILKVPQERAAYANTPLPPEVVVPPRRLPPELQNTTPKDSA